MGRVNFSNETSRNEVDAVLQRLDPGRITIDGLGKVLGLRDENENQAVGDAILTYIQPLTKHATVIATGHPPKLQTTGPYAAKLYNLDYVMRGAGDFQNMADNILIAYRDRTRGGPGLLAQHPNKHRYMADAHDAIQLEMRIVEPDAAFHLVYAGLSDKVRVERDARAVTTCLAKAIDVLGQHPRGLDSTRLQIASSPTEKKNRITQQVVELLKRRPDVAFEKKGRTIIFTLRRRS